MFFLALLAFARVFGGIAEDTLAQMTTEEKAWQLVQIQRTEIGPNDIVGRNIAPGSVYSAGGSVPEGNTPEAWVSMIRGLQEAAQQTRLKIPILYGIDAVHGNNNVQTATMFPHNIGYGATAVGDLDQGVKNVGEEASIVADELEATGNHWTFAPVLGNAQDYRWGRTYESFSSNISIPTALGPAFFKALHGEGEYYRTTGTAKHYIGEGQCRDGKNAYIADLSRDDVVDLLPPYEAVIKAGALIVMPSFGSISYDGAPYLENTHDPYILQDLLKDRLGFEGFCVSDFNAVYNVGPWPGNYPDKVVDCINKGLDMVMTAGEGAWKDAISGVINAVNNGGMTMAKLDDSVLRILRVKEKLGLFENPFPKDPKPVGTPEHRAIARRHAAESFVLLKNQNNLINNLPTFQNILVTGQGGNDIGMQCGGWTKSWNGDHGATVPGTSITEGIEAAGKKVTYSADGTIPAGTFDAIVAVIGEDPYAEGNGDRDGNIELRGVDKDMLAKIEASNIPKVVVMLAGRPMAIGNEVDKWDAFIHLWLPGSEGGDALADILFTDKEFIGKLPHNWRVAVNGETQWAYGYGLTKR